MSQNKTIVEKSQAILEAQGYKVKTSHLYNLFAKLANYPSWNVAKVKQVEFSEVLKDLASQGENPQNKAQTVNYEEQSKLLHELTKELEDGFKQGQRTVYITEEWFVRIQAVDAVTNFKSWLAKLELSGHELIPDLDGSRLGVKKRIIKRLVSSFNDFMKSSLVNKNNSGLLPEQYESKLKSGAFKDKMVYGVKEKDQEFISVFPHEQPGAIFAGAMGSGKSISARFTAATHMLSNGNNTLYFFADMLKGATDYFVLTKDEKNKERINAMRVLGKEAIKELIDITYKECMERKALLAEINEKNIRIYNDKKAVPLAQIQIFIEDFHSFAPAFKGTDTMDKLSSLLRIGRSYEIFFTFATQLLTPETYPGVFYPGISQHFVFKMSKKDASAVNLPHMSEIMSTEKGRAAYDEGFVQFPYLSDEKIMELSKAFPINFNARMLSMNYLNLDSHFKKF